MGNRFIIITSIFHPTKAILEFSKIQDYQLIVVGDKKTPKNWHCKNVIYLDINNQNELNKEFSQALPLNHYGRKMMGYLYAINHDADIIIDTDDDNIPYDNYGFPEFDGKYDQIESSNKFVNIYEEFTNQKIWPRGLPLSYILNIPEKKYLKTDTNVGIWQGLADGDPDVDAIYRLVDNNPCSFNKRNPIVLSNKNICPFNSQNTAFRKELFPLLYLPSFVTFRFTDILRGLVAQPIMHKAGYNLGFTEATVFQERNDHDFMKDFESEIPMYLNAEKVIEITESAIKKDNSMKNNLYNAYMAFENNNIVTKDEIYLLTNWLKFFL